MELATGVPGVVWVLGMCSLSVTAFVCRGCQVNSRLWGGHSGSFGGQANGIWVDGGGSLFLQLVRPT